jgi:predicted transcriptional regulator
MERRGWNQVEFAEAMEASQAAVSRWLRDARNMSAKTVRRFRELQTENIPVPVVTRADIARLVEELPDDELPRLAAQVMGLIEFYRRRAV